MKKNILFDLKFILENVLKGIFLIFPLLFLFLDSALSEYLRVFFIFLSFSFIFFLLAFIKREKETLNVSFLDFLILIFLFFLFASSMFSPDLHSSLFGETSSYSFSFVAIFSAIVFYFFISRYAIQNNNLFNFISNYFLRGFSIFLVIFFSLTLFGNSNFVINNIAFFIAYFFLIFIFSFHKLLFEEMVVKKKKLGAVFFFFMLFAIAFFFPAPQISLFIFVFLSLFFLLVRFKLIVAPHKKIIFISVIVFALGLLVNSNLNFSERKIDFSNTTSIARSAIGGSLFFGSGLGYAQETISFYRDQGMNSLPDWDVRYKHTFSYLSDILIHSGLFVFASFCFLLLFILYYNIKVLKILKQNEQKDFRNFLFITTFLLFYSLHLVFFKFNFFVLILFFTFLGLSFNFLKGVLSKEDYNKLFKPRILLLGKKTPLDARLFYFFLFLIFLLSSLYFFKAVLAESNFLKGGEDDLVTAIKLNQSDTYNTSLSKLYLSQAVSELDVPNKDYGKINSLLDKALITANRAVEVNPRSVKAYETLGIIYREIAPNSSNAYVYAISAFEKAFSLEPQNPVLATEIAKLYFLDDKKERAIQYFNKAIYLKSDYYPANLGIARVMISNTNYDEAVKSLEHLKEFDFNNENVYYDLGRAYFELKNYKEAEKNFKTAVQIFPNFSNALYSLATIYEEEGKVDASKAYYKKVLKLNPVNVELIRKIKELK